MNLRDKVNVINASTVSLDNIHNAGTIVTDGNGNFSSVGLPTGTYGDATHVAQVTVGPNGDITNITNVALSTSGTVTSVGLAAPSQFTVTGSPVTTSGTLTLTWNNQVANSVLAGPTSGGATVPTFRLLVAGDIPALPYVSSVGLTMPGVFSVAGSPVTNSGTFVVTLATQTANTVWAGPVSGGAAAPTFRTLGQSDIALGFPTDYISGLVLSWNSATSISVGTGSCVIPSTGKMETFNSTLTLSALALTASAWSHVYGYDNAGVPAIECVATAPATPYQGTARAKTGDTTRRYLGSVKTDASSNIIQFQIDTANEYRWLVNTASTFRCLSNGKATTKTSVSLTLGMPPTATQAILALVNSDTAVFANLSNPISASTTIIGVPPLGTNGSLDTTFPTDTSQNISYLYSTTPTNGLYVDVAGFTIGR
jgi:hypothetical protein